MSGIGGHEAPHHGETDVWLTPPHVLTALGPFDLDPCAAVDQPWRTATVQFTVKDDGLSQRWDGRVWLNPPYGALVARWLARLAKHGNGIALVFARTDTAWFQGIAQRVDAINFLTPRLTFHRPDGTPGAGNSGGPSCLLAFGPENVVAIERLPGIIVLQPRSTVAAQPGLFG